MNKKERLKELNDFVGKDKVIFLGNLIDHVVYMEDRLEELSKLPFIRVNPKNKTQQKKTESAKLYLALMAQYTQDLKTISYLSGKSAEEEEMSPLRLYIQSLNKGEK